MVKTTAIKKQQNNEDLEFDFEDLVADFDSPDDEIVVDMMAGLIEAHRHQQQTAIELTKLVIGSNATGNMSEKEIFATFRRASEVVSEASPIKELFDKLRD